MRQRNIRNLEEKLADNADFLIEEPKMMKGKWKEVFGNDNPIYLEIGCGKGQFIIKKAADNIDKNFIAVEGQANVIVRAMQKAQAAEYENLRLFIDYVHDLKDYFEKGEIAGIYLNFSDPWPKARHFKRRLTYRGRLANYFEVIKDGGFVEFKTDNDGLFDFTLEEIEEDGFEMVEMTRNLHESEFESKFTTTEYEEKFKAKGKNINYVKIGPKVI